MIGGGIIFSSLEYPGKMSLVIFTGGCILRCPYCHNPEIIDGGEDILLSEIENKIDESLDFIDAVVVTGGEPLMQMDEVKHILEFSKKKGLKTKLDTNGCYPERLKQLTDLIDYIALDVKAPFDKYLEVIGDDVGEKVMETMEISSKSPCFLECRTTFVPGLLEPDDVVKIAKSIQCDIYTLQQFRNRTVLDEKLKKTPNTPPQTLRDIAHKIRPVLGKIKIKSAEFGEEII